MRRTTRAAATLLLLMPFALLSGTATAQQPKVPEDIQNARRDWAVALSDHIAGSWIRPSLVPNGLRCTLRITIDRSGRVLSASTLKGSGSPAFEESVILAIGKASPLPLPSDPRAILETLQPTFTPESLER